MRAISIIIPVVMFLTHINATGVMAAATTTHSAEPYVLHALIHKGEELIASPVVTARPGEAVAMRIGQKFSYKITTFPFSNDVVKIDSIIAVGNDVIRQNIFIRCGVNDVFLSGDIKIDLRFDCL